MTIPNITIGSLPLRVIFVVAGVGCLVCGSLGLRFSDEDYDDSSRRSFGSPVNLESWVDVGTPHGTEVCHHWEVRPDATPKVLKKTVFTGPRFVFVMGLEGTGHHLFHKLGPKCSRCTYDDFDNHFCVCSFKYRDRFSSQSVFNAPTRKDLIHSYNATVAYMHSIRTKYPPSSDKVVFINTLFPWTPPKLTCSSMMSSYPNCAGKCKHWQFTDVRLMAEIFEESGFDFRVVVLDRSAINIMIANTVHRQFGYWSKLAEVYTKLVSDHMVKAQLARIDPLFYACLNFDSLPELPKNLAAFLGFPELKQGIAEVYTKLPNHLTTPQYLEKIGHNLKKHAESLQLFKRGVSEMRHLCSTSPNNHDYDAKALDDRDERVEQLAKESVTQV
eukprot:m.265957 g.265957  ORF g.265957 m.265957 type:complete len:386 (+) comp64630_c0_seq1:362-1519(+)